jgi:glycosyltransferase involved in cell wall biosynthesis
MSQPLSSTIESQTPPSAERITFGPRRRILHIIPTLDQSGAEKQLALTALHLPREKYDVRVIAVTRGGHYEKVLHDAGVDVHVIGKRFKWDPMTLYRLYAMIKEFQPDIVQTWLFAGNAYGRVAAHWAKVPHIIASERCVDEWKSGYHFLIDRFLMRWTDRIVVNAEGIRRFYVRQGLTDQSITTIPNAIEPKPIDNSPTTKIRESLGVPLEVPLVGFIGRLWPQKRVQDLIWATDILRMSGWNFRVVIVGDGPRRVALKRFADALEIMPIVHFVGHRNDVPEIMRALDMLVLPSKFEGLPNVALEAMMAGKPVVGTRIAGTDEVVVDGETGILVPPQQPLELARAIRSILADPALGKRMGAAGRDRVLSHFSIEGMIAKYERLYDEILQPSVSSVRS